MRFNVSQLPRAFYENKSIFGKISADATNPNKRTFVIVILFSSVVICCSPGTKSSVIGPTSIGVCLTHIDQSWLRSPWQQRLPHSIAQTDDQLGPT